MPDAEDYQKVLIAMPGGESKNLYWPWRRWGRIEDYRGEWMPFESPFKKKIFIRRGAISSFEYLGGPYG